MAKKNNNLDMLVDKQDEYDKESQDIIKSLQFARKELNIIESMKRSEGWKLIDKKIREELKERIEAMVKDDPKIQTLLALLKVADTKSMSKMLEDGIASIMPD